LFNIVIYSYLLLPLCFLILKGKIKERFLVIISAYGIFIFALLLIYYLLPKDVKKYYQAFYTFFEYSFFAFVFWYTIQNKKIKRLIIYFSVVFISFQSFFVTITSLQRLDSIPIGIETILIFIYIFFFFYEFSRNNRNLFIYNHHCFWISVGILIYLGGSFFFYLMINHLDTEEINRFGNLTYIAEIIKNVLFAIAMFINKKFSTSENKNSSSKVPNLDMI